MRGRVRHAGRRCGAAPRGRGGGNAGPHGVSRCQAALPVLHPRLLTEDFGTTFAVAPRVIVISGDGSALLAGEAAWIGRDPTPPKHAGNQFGHITLDLVDHNARDRDRRGLAGQLHARLRSGDVLPARREDRRLGGAGRTLHKARADADRSRQGDDLHAQARGRRLHLSLMAPDARAASPHTAEGDERGETTRIRRTLVP